MGQLVTGPVGVRVSRPEPLDYMCSQGPDAAPGPGHLGGISGRLAGAGLRVCVARPVTRAGHRDVKGGSGSAWLLILI